MKKTKLFYSCIVLAIALIFAAPVMALDLQQARAQGIIAEQPNGYVKVIKESPEATQLVNEVNAARTQEYQRISKEKGQPIDVVAKIAAEEIAKKLNAGR